MRVLPFVPLLPLLLGIAIPSRCAAQSQTPPTTSVVEGKVVHEPGGEPIRKVLVRLISTEAGAGRAFVDMEDNGDLQAQAMEFIASFTGETGDANQVYRAITDAEGHFRIEKVPPGKYYVSLSRDGYVFAQTKSGQSIITVTENQNVSELSYKMSAAGLITGKIVDTEGDPITGLVVQAIPKDSAGSQMNSAVTSFISALGAARAFPAVGSTNDLGEFRITGLRPGQYLVIARPRADLIPPPDPEAKGGSSEHVLYAVTYYPGVLDEKQATPLQVSAGTLAAIDFTLQVHRVYHVSGTVSGIVSPKGSSIMLISNSGRPLEQPLGEGGKFDFPSLEPGKYFVQVTTVPRSGQDESLQMLSVPTPIIVSGSDLIDLVLQPLPHGKVSGRCRAEGQDPVDWKQLSIMLMPVADAEESSGEKSIFEMARQIGSPVNEDGTFELGDVAPGKYQVALTSPSEKYRDWYLKSLLFAGQEVADTGFAVNGESAVEVVVSPKGASITGNVVGSAGKPAPNVFVATVPSSGKLARPDAYQTAKTDASGKFVMRGMNPGDFVVVALEGAQQDTRNSEFYEKYGSQGTSVSLAEGDQKTVNLTLISDSPN